MWFLGHTALGFGFAGIVLLASRGRWEPRVLVVVPFLANLIDFFHVEPIRPYSHSILAATLLPLAAILIWHRWARWTRREAVALFAASLGAIAGDLIFGSFYPTMPFVRWDVEWMDFNGVGDLTTEALLGVGLIAVFLLLLRGLSGPRALREFRVPWVISPAAAVAVTSAVFWGEVVEFVARAPWASDPVLAYAFLTVMIVAAALVTAWWILALDLVRRERLERPDRGS